MALYDVNPGKAKARLIPANEPDAIHVEAMRRKLRKPTMDKIERTVDDTVEMIVQKGGGRFVWTRMAALFGHNSPVAHNLLEHLWKYVIEAVGDGKECNIAIGCLLRAAIARRPETHWLMWTEETNDIDADTGKKITINTYWIDTAFVPPSATPLTEQLANSWGARVSNKKVSKHVN